MQTRTRRVGLLLFDEVETLDFAGAVQVLSVAGRHWNWRPFAICTVCSREGLVETRNQIRVEAKYSLTSCPSVELLVIPGGYGARKASRDPATVEWVRRAGSSAELILVVGSGLCVAGAAGLLHQQRVATREEDAQWLVNEPWFTAAPTTSFDTRHFMVNSGSLVSCAHGGGSAHLGLAAIEQLLGASIAARVRTEFVDTLDPEPSTEHRSEVEIIVP